MIANSSKKQYLATYLSLIEKSKTEELEDIYKYIKDSKVKNATKLSYLNSIISLKKLDSKLVKGDLSKIIEYRDRLNIELENLKAKDNLNQHQHEALNKVNLQQLEDFVKKLNDNKNSSKKALEDYLLIAMMVKYPLRNDLQEILLTNYKKDLDGDVNCLYIPNNNNEKAILSLPHYKTSKTHGTLNIMIEKNLINDIKKLIKMDNRQYLFTNQLGNPLSSSNFTQKLNKITKKEFGIPISSTIIRKIYLTSKYGKTLENMKEDAKLLGHNLETQQNTYIANKPIITHKKKIIKKGDTNDNESPTGGPIKIKIV